MALEHSTSSSQITSTDNLRKMLQTARDKLIDKTRLARGGISAVTQYSDRVDSLIRCLYQDVCKYTDTPVALVALGGYGRKQLCLHSDIDLLVLFANKIGQAEKRFLKSILHPLWDIRLELGHQVRYLSDFDRVETDNPEFLVALQDARFLEGDKTLFEQLSERCIGPGTQSAHPTLGALSELIKQRYSQYNQTLYQLEPDVKSSPGALRDVSAARMIANLSGSKKVPGLPAGRVNEAEDFILRVRSIIHLERGRNLNILTHELQEIVACLLGAPDEKPERQVETLMSTYFHHARIICRALNSTFELLKPKSKSKQVSITNDLVYKNNKISFADGTRASLRPRMWLSAFEAALDRNCGVSEKVVTCIERHGERYSPERFFPTNNERDRLLRVLRPRTGLYVMLSTMHDSGLLGRMFPEFQKIYCLVIRDFYHKYTVDEHTLLTIRNLESLCEPTTQSQQRFSGLLKELHNPELLVLALLFHDVGKWTNKNHSEEGVRMALVALRRIGLPESDIGAVEFLIRHHLQMSTAAFRRDAGDPEVIRQFAKLVGTEERLTLLCLLTLADVGAVNPDVMTPWKEELLWKLYVDTYNRLTLGYGDELLDATTASLANVRSSRPSNISEEIFDKFVDGLPQRYLRFVNPNKVYEHIRLSKNLKPSDLHCALEKNESVWELSVISMDQPRLFSKICGVLSYFGMEILHGQAMSNSRGVAVDIFQFTDQDKFLKLNHSAKDELIRLLKDVVAGQEDIDKRISPKARSLAKKVHSRVRSVVHFDNEYSKQFSILEIVAQNAWGLLYRISQVISQYGFDIELVLISTEGNRAIDVFHLMNNGAKLTKEEIKRLSANLEKMLKAEHTAAQKNYLSKKG